MQAIAPVTTAQLLAVGQEPLIKVEIYIGADNWVNLNSMALIFLDEFNDAALDPEWNDEPNNGTIVEAGEVLTLAIANGVNGDFWGAVENGPVCTIDMDNKNVVVITKLNDYTVNDNTRAGLFIANPDGVNPTDGIHFGRARRDAAPARDGLTLIDMNVVELAYVAETTLPIWLRATITGTGAGSTMVFHYSLNGTDWIHVHTQADETWSKAGLLTWNWGLFNAISAPFDFFRVDGFVGENYIEGASISLGGAGMTPAPVAGVWSATVNNINSIFHPQHPTSDYKTWLETERLTRISVGATYGGVDYYWQRIIGYMNEPKFSAPSYKVSISGGDYMKRLQQTELKFLENYWGSTENFVSISSDGKTGAELYAELDAMEIGAGEANNVANWVVHLSTFVSEANVGGGSTWVGKMNTTGLGNFVENLNVAALTAGKMYTVSFKYQKTAGVTLFAVNMSQLVGAAWVVCGSITQLTSAAWVEVSFNFTAIATAAVRMELSMQGSGASAGEVRIDQISIYEFTPYWNRYYDLTDVTETGPYHVTLNAVDVWQAEVDEGWYYAKDAEAGPEPPAHPAGIVFFDNNKVVAVGLAIVVYYFIAQALENVVADLLVYAGLYADQAAALAAMDFVATGFTVDNVWFEAGTTCLDAIKIICERCDYRFFFKYDGTPSFRPKPTAGAADFIFTDPKQITSISTYRDKSEIKNRIIIEGMKQAAPVGGDETLPSELKGEANDATSIALYGERTMTIKNHLFQTQAPIDAMVISLLAEYKDPKWYSDLKMDYNPVPLEMGDTIQWEERLSPTLNITETGVIRDIKINNFSVTYKCVL